MNKKGTIVCQISNLYTVLADGVRYECRARGRFRNEDITPLVGDFVVFDEQKLYILEILKRRNELHRPSIANVDCALVLTSAHPEVNIPLLDKELACIEANDVEPIIVLSKMDLLDVEEMRSTRAILEYYEHLGYKVFSNSELDEIKKVIAGNTVVLTGQTGSGKSSLLNRMDENLNLKTSPISKALGRGVHTTRHTELFRIDNSYIADTPGFSALDIEVERGHLKFLFPEFRDVECRYRDCNHIGENGCKVKALVEEGKIMQSRYDNYVKFWSEL